MYLKWSTVTSTMVLAVVLGGRGTPPAFPLRLHVRLGSLDSMRPTRDVPASVAFGRAFLASSSAFAAGDRPLTLHLISSPLNQHVSVFYVL